MKLSILITVLCLSAVQALKGDDCLDANRYNLEDVCRNECSKENAVAFSVSNDENNDSCRCYPKFEGQGTYIGSGDSRSTCYSMAPGEKTKILDYGDCVIDSINHDDYSSEHTMPKCDGEHQVGCVDEGRHNLEIICREECSKHNSAAFAVSYSEDDDTCRCYPELDGRVYTKYTGSGDIELTCYSMEGPITVIWGYGECVPSGIYGPRFREHTMKRCPQEVGKVLRGSVTA